jgi:hypothetical protein
MNSENNMKGTDGDYISVPFSFANNSGLGDDKIYVQIVGEEDDGRSFFVNYKKDGTFYKIYPRKGSDSVPYARRLDFFENKKLYLPIYKRTALFASALSPIFFKVNENSVVTPPDSLDEEDDSNGFLWDVVVFSRFEIETNSGKFEKRVKFGQSAVNGFTFPIQVAGSMKDGTSQRRGFSGARTEAFESLSKELTGELANLFSKDWTFRSVASTLTGIKKGLIKDDHFSEFGKDLYSFYFTNKKKILQIDSDVNMHGIYYLNTEGSSTGMMHFQSNDRPWYFDIHIPTTMEAWLEGYTNPSWKNKNDDAGRNLVKNLCCAFSTNSFGDLDVYSKESFDELRKKGGYYVPNDDFPFICDPYSKAFHGISNGMITSFVYDDHLSQGGHVECLESDLVSGSFEINKF